MTTTYALPTLQLPLQSPLVNEGALALTTPAVSYARAIELAQQMRADTYSVTSRKGPLAAEIASSRWYELYKSSATSAMAVTSVICGAMTAVLCFGGVPTWSPWLAGAATAVSAATGIVLKVREVALFEASNKHAREQLDSDDVSVALRTFATASAEERSVLAPMVRAALAKVDKSLSAKASLTRDQLMVDPPAPGTPDARVSLITTTIDGLRNGATLDDLDLATIRRVINEAGPEERKTIAATLEGHLFASEKSLFEGTQERTRTLYRLIDVAHAGNALSADSNGH